MDKFIELVAEVFEVEPEEVTMETVFREEIENFSSKNKFFIQIANK